MCMASYSLPANLYSKGVCVYTVAILAIKTGVPKGLGLGPGPLVHYVKSFATQDVSVLRFQPVPPRYLRHNAEYGISWRIVKCHMSWL